MFDSFVQEAPVWVSLFIGCVSGCLFSMLMRVLLDALFRMHRQPEETAAVLEKYSTWERFFMEHIYKETLHEDDFARWMTVYHGLGICLLWAELLLAVPALFMDAARMVMGVVAVLLLMVFYVPSLILHFVLSDGDREGMPCFRFEKYHMTNERDELM